MTNLWSEDAERQFLSVVLNGEALDMAVELLPTAEAFYKPAHRRVYEATLLLHGRGEIVSSNRVGETIADINAIGGYSMLADIVTTYPGTDRYLKSDAAKIKSCYIRRQAQEVFRRGLEGISSDAPIDTILAEAEQDIYRLRVGSSTKRLVHIAEIMPDTLEEIQDWQSGKIQERLIQTGFPDFDRLLVGVMPGDLMVIGGKTSHGKSQAAIQMAAYVAKHAAGTGKAVVILSLEMTNAEVNKRVLLSETRIDGMRVKRQLLKDEEFDKLTRVGMDLCTRPIYYLDDTNTTMSELQSFCRKLRTEREIGLVVIDYLQLMVSSVRQETREQDIAALARGCKWLAKDLNCPVVALSQFRKMERSSESKEPGLDDLRESGAIPHAADWVIFVWRQEEQGRSYLVLKKARHGRTGKVEMAFEDGRWETLAPVSTADERYIPSDREMMF